MDEKNNIYHDFYKNAKITNDELKRFPDFQTKSEEELDTIADLLFDLAILFQKINIEAYER